MAKIETEEVTVKYYTVTLTEEETEGLLMLLGHGTAGDTCDRLNLKSLWKALDALDFNYQFPYFQNIAQLERSLA